MGKYEGAKRSIFYLATVRSWARSPWTMSARMPMTSQAFGPRSQVVTIPYGTRYDRLYFLLFVSGQKIYPPIVNWHGVVNKKKGGKGRRRLSVMSPKMM